MQVRGRLLAAPAECALPARQAAAPDAWALPGPLLPALKHTAGRIDALNWGLGLQTQRCRWLAAWLAVTVRVPARRQLRDRRHNRLRHALALQG